MPDVPILPEPEPEDDFAAKLRAMRDRMDDGARVALTGSHARPVRRPALFVITGVGIALGWPWLALAALIALAVTDSVIE